MADNMSSSSSITSRIRRRKANRIDTLLRRFDDLPSHLQLDILNRIDSSDLARCRIVSKTLNSLSREIRSINLNCSYEWYAQTRFRPNNSSMKEIFNKLVSELPIVERITIGVDNARSYVPHERDERLFDDLFLIDCDFVKEWLPDVCEKLRFLSISNFWAQARWRRSAVLKLITFCCASLLELEIKKAWLTAKGLTFMPNLTTLTLEFVKLEDDANLDKVNECFPSLRVLNLIVVRGLKKPKIHLKHLKTCNLSLNDSPASMTIIGPSLVKLRLIWADPNPLLIEAPLLSDLHLSMHNAGNLKVKEFHNLRKLHLASMELRNLLGTLPFGSTVKNLTVVSTLYTVPVGVTKSSLELLLSVCPNVTYLTLTPTAWSEFEANHKLTSEESRTKMKGLEGITAYIAVDDGIEVTLSTIFFLLDNCSSLSYMSLFVHRCVDSTVTRGLISRCMGHSCAKVSWKFGVWTGGNLRCLDSDGGIIE